MSYSLSEEELQEAEDIHLANMPDQVVLRKRTGETRDSNGYLSPVWEEVYSGKGLVKSERINQVHSEERVTQPIVVLDYLAKLPRSVILEDQGDYQLEVVESRDSNNLGFYSVQGTKSGGYSTYRKLILQKV